MIEKEVLEDLYINKKYSQVKIGEILGCSDWKVRKYMKKYDIKIRSSREQALKYSVNDDFFDIIDTQNKSYILGFLYADGYIQKQREHNSRKLGVSIKNSDIDLLKEINNELESNYPIKEYDVKSGYKIGVKYVRLLISSPKLCEDIIEKGCLENKTENLYFPNEKQVPLHLLPSFLRGYFDGDGSIRKVKSWKVSIMGTIPFLEDLIKLFGFENKKLYHRHPESKTINRELSLNLNESLDFLEFINKHEGIRLKRKDTKIQEMLKQYSRL